MKQYRITVNGNTYDVTVEETAVSTAAASVVQPVPQAPAAAPPKAAPAPVAPPAPSPAPKGAVKIESPLPGNIYKITAAPGQPIQKGQVLLIIEAMKMENEIVSPQDGIVASINVTEGSTVNLGDLLMTLD